MLEFSIALLIFSLGILGLLSAQVVGKKSGYEASQRSVATALARDILERMRANPGQISAYRISGAGDVRQPLPLPGVNCDASDCTAAQLAVFDLWQWESAMLGTAETYSGGNAGGLVSPRACITSKDGDVVVAVSWQGLSAATRTSTSVCTEADAGNPVSDDEAGESALRRHSLAISTFIGER